VTKLQLRNVLTYSAAFLLALLAVPISLLLPLVFVPVVLGIFGLLLAMVIWAKANAPELAREQSAALDRQSQRPNRSILYDEDLGLYQQWYLELRLNEEMARCKRYGLTFALIVIKLHETSWPNMTAHGWDDVSQAAYMTARSVRTVDLTAALGRGEFAVCLVHCDKDGAEIARHRIESALRLHRPSTGLVVFPLEQVGSKDMIKLARSRALATEARAA